MKLPELQQEIKEEKVRPFYLFTGEEVAVRDIYIDLIAKIKEVEPTRADNLKDIFSTMTKESFLSVPKVYVITEDTEYTKQEQLWEGMKKGIYQGDHTIIMNYNNIDKRKKFYKQHKDIFTEFSKLSPTVLANYIQKDIGLKQLPAKQLAERCDYNYSIIRLEEDKLKHLSNANNITIEEAYKLAIEEDLIYTPPKDKIFDLVDAICTRKPALSLQLAEEYEQVDSGPLGVITLLYNNFRSMLLVQAAGNVNNISERTGLTGWEIKLAKEKGRKYSVPELVKIIRFIRELEKKVKTGQADVKQVLTHLIIGVM